MHRTICQDRTRRVSLPQRRSVQGMGKPLAYRMSNRDPVPQAPVYNHVAQGHHDRSLSSSQEPTLRQKQEWWMRNHLTSGTARHLSRAVDRSRPSRFLCAEEVRIGCGLSEQQIAAIMTLSRSMFEPNSPTPMTQSVSTARAPDVQDWENTVMLYQEHQTLRETILCRDGRKRDSETRAEIVRRHAGIAPVVRENYLKSMRRLEVFCEKTALPFPPNGNVFLHWYGHCSTLLGWTCGY